MLVSLTSSQRKPSTSLHEPGKRTRFINDESFESIPLNNLTFNFSLTKISIKLDHYNLLVQSSVGYGINVTSFLVFHTKVTVNIGLKEAVRMVTSIPLIKCLCYKPERVKQQLQNKTMFNSCERLLLGTI